MAVAVAGYCAYGLPQSIEEIPSWATGLAVVTITSLLVDIDEPRSRIGALIMPLIPSWLRPFAFLVVGGYLTYWGYFNHLYVAIIGAVLLVCALMKHRDSPTHSWIGIVGSFAVTTVWFPEHMVAALIGYGSHLLLDAITEGIPLFWPFKFWLRIQVTTTNSLLEQFVFYHGARACIFYFLVLAYVPHDVLKFLTI